MQSVRRVVNWFKKNIPDTRSSVLDLGCGNGIMLLELVSPWQLVFGEFIFSYRFETMIISARLVYTV